MVPKVTISAMPCPDPACVDGVILVYNAYSEDPTKPEEQPCDLCQTSGFVVTQTVAEN